MLVFYWGWAPSCRTSEGCLISGTGIWSVLLSPCLCGWLGALQAWWSHWQRPCATPPSTSTTTGKNLMPSLSQSWKWKYWGHLVYMSPGCCTPNFCCCSPNHLLLEGAHKSDIQSSISYVSLMTRPPADTGSVACIHWWSNRGTPSSSPRVFLTNVSNLFNRSSKQLKAFLYHSWDPSFEMICI